MARTFLLMLTALSVSGCTAAGATSFDSSDPVLCVSLFAAGAGHIGRGPMADELNARTIFLAQSNGGPEWLSKVTPRAMEIGRLLGEAGDQDQVTRLLDECMDRQDADPDFLAARPALLAEAKQIRAPISKSRQ